MKKLMIAAAAAVLTGAAFASGDVGQVYDAKITVKSTVCKKAKASGTWLLAVENKKKGEAVIYRAQGSRTILGLLWGCGCDQAFGSAWEPTEGSTDEFPIYAGNVFWDKASGDFIGDDYADTRTEFVLINRIGKKATDAEIVWTLAVDGKDEDGETTGTGTLTLAGFGTISDSKVAVTVDEDGETVGEDCNSVLKSAKGGVAGTLAAPGMSDSDPYCIPCGTPNAPYGCEAWEFCSCSGAFYDADQTAAYGTWTIKYNAKASKAWSDTGRITSAYTKFPTKVATALVAAKE